jgi:hypothetical protein
MMLYFSQAPYTLTTAAETDQIRLVLAFKEEFSDKGIWWPYAGKDDFATTVRHHLSQLLRDRYPTSAASSLPPAPQGGTGERGADASPRRMLSQHGLTALDTTIFKALCVHAIEQGSTCSIVPGAVRYQDDIRTASDDAFRETITYLVEQGYLRSTGPRPGLVCDITSFGFEQYALAFVPHYTEQVEAIKRELAHQQNMETKLLSPLLGVDATVVNHVLHVLEDEGLIQTRKFMSSGNNVEVYSVAVALQRAYQAGPPE